MLALRVLGFSTPPLPGPFFTLTHKDAIHVLGPCLTMLDWKVAPMRDSQLLPTSSWPRHGGKSTDLLDGFLRLHEIAYSIFFWENRERIQPFFGGVSRFQPTPCLRESEMELGWILRAPDFRLWLRVNIWLEKKSGEHVLCVKIFVEKIYHKLLFIQYIILIFYGPNSIKIGKRSNISNSSIKFWSPRPGILDP